MGDRPPRDLNRQALAEVVEPRYDELFTLVQDELRRSGYDNLIAAGIVLTGGTSKMEGAVELAEEIFHMPVRLAMPKGVNGMGDILQNPIFSTSIGLLHYAREDQPQGSSASPARPSVEINKPISPDLMTPVSPKAVKQKKNQPSAVSRFKTWLTGNF